MIKQAERIETIAHLLIDKAAEVAASIAKAIVTLVCLEGSIAYTTGVKLRETFDNYNQDKPYQATVATEDAVNSTNSEVSEDITDNQGEEPEVEISEIVDLTQGIVTIIDSINLVKPIIAIVLDS